MNGLTAGEAARRLGVAVTTLRSWHQRYGLGPTGYVPGRHRRYTDEDMRRLTLMHQLASGGLPAAQAAATALAARDLGAEGMAGLDLAGPDLAGPDRAGPVVGATDLTAGGSAATDLAAGGLAGRDVTAGGLAGRDVTAAGRQPAPAATQMPDRQAARGLVRAALRLDPSTAIDVVAASVAERGVVATWDDLVRPAFALLVARQQAGQALVDAEHLLSGCISTVLSSVRRTAPAPSPVLLACTAEEQHTLPLEALAAALAETGHGCRLLGARVPADALHRAISRTGPIVLLLWSHDSGTADPALLRAVLAGRPRPAVVMAAGPGWAGARLPAEVLQPADLREALRHTRTALG